MLGSVSLIFVAWFTLRVYRDATGPGQTPRGAIIEAWVNILIGFSVNFVVNLALLPLLLAKFSLWDNFWLGWIYTAVSIVRQYLIRRFFNDLMVRASHRWGGGR